MGWFGDSKEDKLYKALEDFEIHTTDLTVNKTIEKSEFFMETGLNTYDILIGVINWAKEEGYNGMVGLQMTPSAGLGGAQAIIIIGMAVKFS